MRVCTSVHLCACTNVFALVYMCVSQYMSSMLGVPIVTTSQSDALLVHKADALGFPPAAAVVDFTQVRVCVYVC